MLTSLALIFLLGLLLGAVFNRMNLPSLLGMIVTGIMIGPNILNLIDGSILNISAQLRQLALVIILTRAGLSLKLSDLKKVGRPAILMCFVPACFEMIGTILIAPRILGVTILEAAIMGAVLAAVSPAVVVPRMLRLMEEGYGKEKSIPQLILAGASVDDVFVIVVFTALLGLANGDAVTAMNFVQIPVSIVMGILLGGALGILLTIIFKRFHMRDSVKLLIVLSVSFLLLELEKQLASVVAVSGLLAIMSMGIGINQKYPVVARRLSDRYNRLWVGAECLLFVLVGASVDISYALKSGIFAVIVVVFSLCFRMAGVSVCMLRTNLNRKERLFCMGAYTPKATVQAGIGGIPLAMGLACGQTVLTVAVLSILITAPFGALFIDRTYQIVLDRKDKTCT